MTALQIYRDPYHSAELSLPVPLAGFPSPLSRMKDDGCSDRCTRRPAYMTDRLVYGNRNRNAAHHIVQLEIAFRAQRVGVMAIDARG
jgi:hypothetical protein